MTTTETKSLAASINDWIDAVNEGRAHDDACITFGANCVPGDGVSPLFEFWSSGSAYNDCFDDDQVVIASLDELGDNIESGDGQHWAEAYGPALLEQDY
jgi:hypothetical protein